MFMFMMRDYFKELNKLNDNVFDQCITETNLWFKVNSPYDIQQNYDSY